MVQKWDPRFYVGVNSTPSNSDMTIRLTPFSPIYTDLNFTPSDSDKKYENAGNVRGHPPIQQIHTLQLSRTHMQTATLCTKFYVIDLL